MSDAVTIRAAEPNDANTLVQFNIAMAWETERKRLDPATVVRGVRTVLANASHGFYVVAIVAGETAGSLLVTYEWSDWRCGRFWWIQSVYVQPECRRMGVFKELYEFIREQASRNPDVCGLRLYVEQSNHTAQNTYTRIGLEETPYRLYEKLL
jgi:GNAT superfamily N-acetyltransferase